MLTKTAKRVFGVRLDPDLIERITTKAKIEDMTPAEYTEHCFREAERVWKQDGTINDLVSQVRDLEAALEKATGRRPGMKKRVSISMTEGQYRALKAAAKKGGTTQAALVRQMLPQGPPELT